MAADGNVWGVARAEQIRDINGEKWDRQAVRVLCVCVERGRGERGWTGEERVGQRVEYAQGEESRRLSC